MLFPGLHNHGSMLWLTHQQQWGGRQQTKKTNEPIDL